MKNYGNAIKKLRRNADITQAQLAKKLNVSSQTVSKWENGVNLPDILSLEEMCAFFGVTMEEFLKLADGGELITSAPAQTPPAANIEPVSAVSENTIPAASAETVPPVAPAVSAAPAVPASTASAARRKIQPWVIVLIVAVISVYVIFTVVGIVLFATKNPYGWIKDNSIVYTAKFTYEGKMIKKQYVYGVNHRLPEEQFERTGYTQTGWICDGKTYDLGEDIVYGLSDKGSSVITVEPVWTPIEYTLHVEFDQCVYFLGHSYERYEYAKITCVYGKDPTEIINGVNGDGLILEGWDFYSADGKLYEGDLRYINPDPDAVITARAKWVSSSYDLELYNRENDAVPLKTVRLNGREEYTLPLIETFNISDRKGYHGCWGIYGSYKSYKDGATVSDLMVESFVSGGGYSVELFIKWEPNTFTINFDANGGLGSMDKQKCYYGELKIIAPNCFVKDGYVFAGWQYGDRIFYEGSRVCEIFANDGAELTFTARWIKEFEEKGTQADPYKVSDFDQLKKVSFLVEYISGYDRAHYELTADIDCGGGELTAIGYNYPFKGVFDGKGHVIKNAVFAATTKSEESSTGYKGLFAKVFGGQIANVGLKDYVIDGTDGCSVFAPLVCSYISELPLQNCFAEGTISWEDGSGDFAGLVYTLCGKAVNCYSVCTFDMKYTHSVYWEGIFVGGFVGNILGTGQKWDGKSELTVTESSAENCYADAHINVSGVPSIENGYYHYMGLFSAKQSESKNCFATGEITYDCMYNYMPNIRYDVNLFSGNINYNTYNNVYVSDSAQIVFNDRVISEVPTSIIKTEDDNLCSLEWLKANADFDDTVWQENEGALPTLKAFAS